MAQEIVIIFPHHLFDTHKALAKDRLICLVEDPLFFYDKTYPAHFHIQKLIFHRASMKHYSNELKKLGYKTLYIDAQDLKEGQKSYKALFKKLDVEVCHVAEFDDCILSQRIQKAAKATKTALMIYPSPSFLTPSSLFEELFRGKKHLFFHTFYIEQRKRLQVLVDPQNKPLGGKWSFDKENRKKAPKGLTFTRPPPPPRDKEVDAAKDYVHKHFPKALGDCTSFNYSVTRDAALSHLKDFIHHKLSHFGDYEDAMLKGERILYHSVLSPLINAGLITPYDVVAETLCYADKTEVPLNSLEGFLRQVIGWREFIRGVYLHKGVEQRKKNFFKHKRKMPSCFYEGTSGIEPIDHCILQLKEHAYLHHIERLMVLGNFFLLCEIDPDDVYRWFMEFFIDAYDWVMVPNVYGMSQYADGGLMTTKPYLSSSNYILKMSDFKKGPWCEVWDALFWRFMIKHLSFFEKQPRLSILCDMAKKKKGDKEMLKVAEDFLRGLL